MAFYMVWFVAVVLCCLYPASHARPAEPCGSNGQNRIDLVGVECHDIDY